MGIKTKNADTLARNALSALEDTASALESATSLYVDEQVAKVKQAERLYNEAREAGEKATQTAAVSFKIRDLITP